MTILNALPPSSPVGKEIVELFSYPWQSLEGVVKADGKTSWRTITAYPIRPRSLYKKFLDIDIQAGVRFAHATNYGLIDIDSGSPHHSPEGVARIASVLETLGIVATVLIRSSHSEGLHLYYKLPKTVKTFDLACAVSQALEAQGITLKAGEVEVFPNVKKYGRWWLNECTEYNGHRLPLQAGSGSCLLDDDLNPRPSSIERFLWEMNAAAAKQDMALLLAALPVGRANQSKRRRRVARKSAIWQADLELEIGEGWTGHHQTNVLLKAIGCYCHVFLGLKGQDLIDRMEVIACTAPGYEQFCRHHDDILPKITAWATAVEGYYWPMGTEPTRNKATADRNAASAAEAIARIKATVSRLAIAGELKEGIRRRRDQLAAIAHTSNQTLQKYADLWHPNFWNVPPATEGLQADSPPLTPSPPHPLEPLPNGSVHSIPKVMKGGSLNFPNPKPFPPG